MSVEFLVHRRFRSWRCVAALTVAVAVAGAGAGATAGAPLLTVYGGGPVTPQEGAPATRTFMAVPGPVAALPSGGFLVGELQDQIWRVHPDGRASFFAGSSDPAVEFGGDGGPAIAAHFNGIQDIEALADGSVLVADTGNDRIRHISASGTVSTVAGGGTAHPGDGGPATAARLASPVSVAAMPDGGFLIADSATHRIRRVDPAGTITTVAGTGLRADRGDGGPATRSALAAPTGVAVLPDGGFVAATECRIRRVSGNGTIDSLYRVKRSSSCSVSDVEASADGSVYVVNGGRVLRITAEGRRSVVAGGGRKLAFDGDGQPASKAALGDLASISLTSEGNVLFSHENWRWPARVRLLALARPSHLAIAMLPGTRIMRRALDLRFRVTAPARLRIQLRRGAHVVTTAERLILAGRRRLRIPTALRSGAQYTLDVTADDAMGRIAEVHADVVADGLLTKRLARRAMLEMAIVGEQYLDVPIYITDCRRFARGRIDCEISASRNGCDESMTVLLRRNGQLFERGYGCPVRRRPRRPQALEAMWPLNRGELVSRSRSR